MIEINGDYCPNVIQTCLNVDKSIHNVNGYPRCLQFAPSACISKKKVHLHYCIDKYEYPNQEGVKPDVMVSWYDMKASCESQGKHICQDREWTFACEGEEMLPYPYGYVRDDTTCNIDKPQRPWFQAEHSNMTPDIVARLDQRVASGDMPCVSPFGVYDMTGNVDEWVVNSSGKPYISGLKGGHWVAGARNRCRPQTEIHGPTTVYYEIGGRCCKDIQ